MRFLLLAIQGVAGFLRNLQLLSGVSNVVEIFFVRRYLIDIPKRTSSFETVSLHHPTAAWLDTEHFIADDDSSQMFPGRDVARVFMNTPFTH